MVDIFRVGERCQQWDRKIQIPLSSLFVIHLTKNPYNIKEPYFRYKIKHKKIINKKTVACEIKINESVPLLPTLKHMGYHGTRLGEQWDSLFRKGVNNGTKKLRFL